MFEVSLRGLPGFVRAHLLRVHVWIADGGRDACVSQSTKPVLTLPDNIFLCLQGKPVSHNFLPLEMTAAKGATSVQVVSRVTWAVAEEIVITPTDYGADPSSAALDPCLACACCTGCLCDDADGRRPTYCVTMCVCVLCVHVPPYLCCGDHRHACRRGAHHHRSVIYGHRQVDHPLCRALAALARVDTATLAEVALAARVIVQTVVILVEHRLARPAGGAPKGNADHGDDAAARLCAARVLEANAVAVW